MTQTPESFISLPPSRRGACEHPGPAGDREQAGGAFVDDLGGEEVAFGDARADAGAVVAEQLVHDRQDPLVHPHVGAAGHAPVELQDVEPEESLAARAPRHEVGVESIVAFEAEAGHLVEEQREQRDELRALEQVDVERILEIGGSIRRDHERAAIGVQHPGKLGDVRDRVLEMLDDV